jgi:hypothetical protein
MIASMLKNRRGLARLTSVVVLEYLVLLATTVSASGATDPTLSVSPTTATPEETMQFTGYNWTNCGGVTVSLNGRPIAGFGNTNGFIGGDFAAPSVTGTYTLIATATSTSPGCSSQRATFTVVAAPPSGPPSLFVTVGPFSPPPAIPGQPMDFVGGDWANCGAITVALGPTTVATFPSGSPSIIGRFAAPSTLGSYTLTATGTSTSSTCRVTADFDVVAAPTLSASPTTAITGETIHYSGTIDCGSVSVTIGPSFYARTQIATFPSGRISGSFAAPSPPGSYTLTAIGENAQALHASEFVNLALCETGVAFHVLAAPTPHEVSGVLPGVDSSHGEPEAGAAPVLPSPLHVTG